MRSYPSALLSNASCIALPCNKELAQLARDNPQAFEALRSRLIAETIERAPERLQLRLRQLQFRIDGIRRRARTPLGALIEMQSMMWDSFLRLDDALHQFSARPRADAQRRDTYAGATRRSASVIDIRTRHPLGG